MKEQRVADDEERPRLLSWVPKLAGRRVLVIGDLCLDEYLIGRADRLSREAPVPVLEFQQRFTVPGAAANPALNIVALGSRAVVVGVVGDDEAGFMLRERLMERGVDVEGIVVDPTRPTTVKMRVLAELSLRFPQQIVRIDRQERRPLGQRTRRKLLAVLRDRAPEVDAVLFSDYRSGVVDALMVRETLRLSAAHGCLVTADSQGELRKFRDLMLVRCNREEAELALGRALRTEEALERALRELQRRLRAQGVVVTLGGDGMALVDAHGAFDCFPAANRSEVFDTTGAGDTVIAVLTLACAAGAPLREAAQLANVAAGIVVRRLGNATPTAEEMVQALGVA
jgi:rfaE bifunctional protein kinase chain/domain